MAARQQGRVAGAPSRGVGQPRARSPVGRRLLAIADAIVVAGLIVVAVAAGCRCGASPLAGIPKHEALARLGREGAVVRELVTGLEGLCKRARERNLLQRNASAESVVRNRAELRYFLAAFIDYTRALDSLRSRYELRDGLDDRLEAEVFLLAYAAELALYVNTAELLHETVNQPSYEAVFSDPAADVGLHDGAWRSLKTAFNLQPWQRPLALAHIQHRALAKTYARHGIGERHAWAASYIDGQVNRMMLLGVQVGPGVLLREWKDLLGAGFRRLWFPVQKGVSGWMGDTRLVADHRHLVALEQLEKARESLQPGDIILERRNWYLSNVGLPGFWPHAALYVGTPAEAEAMLGAERVTAWRRTHARAMESWEGKDTGGHQLRVLEAVSEGVIFSSFEHTGLADYVAVLRPRLDRAAIAAAIDRALGYLGRPYDFDFDFRTDTAVVCSELVYKSYEPAPGVPGLKLPMAEILGRPVVSPTGIAAAFAAGRGKPDQQLDFVVFLEGIEAEKRAHVRDEAAFAASATRAKWDVVQP